MTIDQMIILSHPWALQEFYDGRGVFMKSRRRIEIEEFGLRKVVTVIHEPDALRGFDIKHIHFMDHQPTIEMLEMASHRVRRHDGGSITIKGELKYVYSYR